MCLASRSQTSPPNAIESAQLIRAGLGPKRLTFFDYDSAMELHETFVSSYPKLVDGGGYELMRTTAGANRALYVIPSPPGGYSIEFIKKVCGQAKFYVRPIQANLSLDSVDDGAKVSGSVTVF